MPDGPLDKVTQQQAHVIGFDYMLIPFDNVRCERTFNTTLIRGLFFANKSRRVKIHIKYDRDGLIYP